jgi:tetratricopeptide (TPR) repeat protein
MYTKKFLFTLLLSLNATMTTPAGNAIINDKKNITIEPTKQRALLNLASTHYMAGDIEAALETYSSILNITPDCLEARSNIAHVQRYIGDVSNALENYKLALAASPDNLNLQYGYAETLLCTGNFAQGWLYFESRWKRDNDSRHFANHLWNGTQHDVLGKIILIRAEYGHGDTIQFIRFARQLKSMGAIVIAEVQRPLVNLLSRCPFLDKVICVGQALPAYDLQVPVMSFPYLLKLHTEIDYALREPYITPNPTLVQHWKTELARDENFKIGICWSGCTYYDSLRSQRSKKALHLSTFKPLACIPHVTLYSLQVSQARAHIAEVDFNVRDLGPDFDVQHGGYMDTAALMKSLDLVITIDTSVAHLAGALGIPVWVILPSVADWRWMKDRTDTPWYPTMRLFRQSTYGEWQSVFEKIAHEVSTLMNKHTQKNDMVTAEISIGELIDKITILQLKTNFINDPEKLKNITTELNTLCATRDACVPSCPELDALTQQLYDVNQKLWNIEDACRNKERNKEFDEEFITITRNVYVNNDERCAIKRKINNLMGSRLIEEKSYAAY